MIRRLMYGCKRKGGPARSQKRSWTGYYRWEEACHSQVEEHHLQEADTASYILGPAAGGKSSASGCVCVSVSGLRLKGEEL
jgi:hypothetical protein